MLVSGKIWAETVCCSFIVLSACWFQERSELRLSVAHPLCCQHVGTRKELSWNYLSLFHSIVNILVLWKMGAETVCCSFTMLSTCWFQERSELRLHVALSQCCQLICSRTDLVALSRCCQHVGSRKDLSWVFCCSFTVLWTCWFQENLSWYCLLLFHSVVSTLVPGKSELILFLLFHSFVYMLVPGKVWA